MRYTKKVANLLSKLKVSKNLKFGHDNEDKVMSACEPSGSSDWCLTRFKSHDAPRSISNPPWKGY